MDTNAFVRCVCVCVVIPVKCMYLYIYIYIAQFLDIGNPKYLRNEQIKAQREEIQNGLYVIHRNTPL